MSFSGLTRKSERIKMSETKSVKKQWITTIIVLVLIGGTAFASFAIIKKAKDKKAARTLQTAPKGSDEWNKANERLQNRGYLAQGRDGRIYATKAYDDLTKKTQGGAFAQLRAGLNELKQDYNESAISQSDARHDHSEGNNDLSKGYSSKENMMQGERLGEAQSTSKTGKNGEKEYTGTNTDVVMPWTHNS